MAIPNDVYVLVTDIAEGDGGLLCNTDRNDCCRASDGVAQGQWYLPDRSQVGSFTEVDTGHPRNFFYRNRFTGIVRFNRLSDPPERGRFHCEIPNDDGDTVTLYVNIGEWFVLSSTVDNITVLVHVTLCFILLQWTCYQLHLHSQSLL